MTTSRFARRSSQAARRSSRLVAFGRQGLALLVAASIAAAAGPARAETYTVTDCSAASFFGTLGGGLTGTYDTIVFAVSCPTIQLCPLTGGCIQNSTLVINSSVNIIGPGAASLAIVGGGDAPVFRIDGAGTTVSISGLTIRGGGIFDTAGDFDTGGGIRNQGNLTLDSTVVRDNDGWYGGGIYNTGTLTVIDSTVSGNRAVAASYGGGIYSSGPVTIVASTIADNHADTPGYAVGGGLFASGDLITIANSTFADNSAGLSGGAIYFAGPNSIFGGPASTISNSTLTGNSALVSALQGDFPFGLTVTASILANAASTPANCSVTVSGIPFPFQSAGSYNVVDDGSCAFSGAGNLNSTPAGLDAAGLQDNGGPTPTVKLTAGSAAIDNVTSAAACPAADQRGAARSVPCDAGAVEFEVPVAGPTPVVASVQPSFGYVTGGLTGVVTGAGFTGATGVMIGGTSATGVVVNGDRSISFTLPAAAAPGVVDVTVLGPGGAPSAVNPTARYTYFPLPVPTTVPCSGGICPYASTNVNMTVTTECNVCNPAFEVQEAIGGATDGFFRDTRCPSGWAYDPKQVKWNVAGLSGPSSLTASVSVAMTADGKPLPTKFCYTDRPQLIPVPGLARAASTAEVTKGKSLRPCNAKKPVPPCIKETVPGSGEATVTLLLPNDGEGAFIFGAKVPKLGKPKPAAGAVGSTVVVSGSGLDPVEAVVIGGVEAPIVARTKSKLTVTVPAGAQTGPVSITGPFGVVTGKSDFVVN